jgi:hypothetical protein
VWRRILFLDIDGVVNTSADKDPDFMNPKHLDVLNELQDQLGFELVLSSTWRMYYDKETFNKKFLGFGAKNPVVDFTPRPWQLEDPDIWSHGGMTYRGDEILFWLNKHQLTPGKNCSICILDDMESAYFRKLKKYHVLTSMEAGLHRGHMKHIKFMFEKQEKVK